MAGKKTVQPEGAGIAAKAKTADAPTEAPKQSADKTTDTRLHRIENELSRLKALLHLHGIRHKATEPETAE